MTKQTALGPNSIIGIFGGGQLGRMLSSAAHELGYQTHIFTGRDKDPACQNTPFQTIAAYDDEKAIKQFASQVDVITYEFENIPAETIQIAAKETAVYPPLKALITTQDRGLEKTFLKENNIPIAPFAPIDHPDDLKSAMGQPHFANAILKTRRDGYDGKGQVRLHKEDKIESAYEAIASRPAILEQMIDFQFEFSLICVRGLNGDTQFYDCPLNEHKDQILHRSIIPSPVPTKIEDQAKQIGQKILEAFDYVGVLAIEFFYLGEGADQPILVNEMAPRVHNSGHWTMDACGHSQFTNHIRAITGHKIAKTTRHSDAEMINLIGPDYLKESQAHDHTHDQKGAIWHLYGKRDPRQGRKMGHINLLQPKSESGKA